MDTSGQLDRNTEALRARQARVGIIANPAQQRLPAHLPRDIWHRWPDLRSKRRLQKQGHEGGQDSRKTDPVLDGDLLDELRSEYRERRLARMGNGTMRALGLSGSGASEVAGRLLAKSANWLAAIRKLQKESLAHISTKRR
ncbi:MAG: hypothetical protein JJT99_11035 [Rhodobacteraceae bacterium]|nr:hypothetical protein [Paracoccaceae bacterium]